jgi:Tfp pilus assembly protein FimT
MLLKREILSMKKASKLNSNLPPLNLPLSGGEQKRGLFKDHDSQSAFILIELAIVVVVLGLLIIGVVGGSSIIDSANLKSQISEITQFDTAANTFMLEYNALPGDLARDDAIEYGFDVSVYSNDSVVHNQNGIINMYYTNNISQSVFNSGHTAMYYNWGEPMFFFIHMSNAELLNYNFFEQGYSSGEGQQSGTHGPALKIGNKSYFIVVNTSKSGQLYYLMGVREGFTGHYGGRLGGLTPKLGNNIDKKLDDGNPKRGNIRAVRFQDGVIYDTTSDCVQNLGTDYNLSFQDEDCSIYIKANIAKGKI